MGTLAPDRLSMLRRVATIESIGSSTRIEGSKLTGASRNTLKQHLRALVERGALDRHGSGRGIWYGLR